MDNELIKDVRLKIYSGNGFYIIKDFVSESHIPLIQEAWTSDIAYEFSDFIANKDVIPGCLPYVYNRPSNEDFAYCTHIWNDPLDELLHSYAFKAQMVRNRVEGLPIFSGLHESTGKALQYRVCRTVSSGTVVKKHADFFDEFRKDPTGDHSFDPSRVQLTLILSDYGTDYTRGGFKLWNNEDKPITFGKDVSVVAGDLIVWRYTIPHEVSDVEPINEKVGFLRAIFPQFDTKIGVK